MITPSTSSEASDSTNIPRTCSVITVRSSPHIDHFSWGQVAQYRGVITHYLTGESVKSPGYPLASNRLQTSTFSSPYALDFKCC